MPAPIVMVHGAFCGGWAFERFADPFIRAGHAVATPDLPGHGDDAGPVSGLSMSDYARAIARVVRAQPRPPILIGHSLGGLVSALAAAQAPTAGLVLLAPSTPWGLTGASMEEAVSAVSLYSLGAYWFQAIAPDYATLRRFSVERMPRAERRAVFERMGSESGRALWETLNWWLDPFMTTMIHPTRIAAPVLAVAGGRDVVHPAATVRETARRLGATFHVFEDMSHWLLAEPGYERVAALVLEWIAESSALSAA
ncbi:MAG: alpha/beta fold hydrolase [Caulobacterales bacterium]